MRFLFILLVALFAGFFVNPAVHAKATKPKITKSNIATRIILYDKPSSSAKKVAKIDPWQNLVPIYQKGDWIKVGDPTDGKVGWINIKEYRTTIAKIARPRVKTIYIQTTADKSGKTGKREITVYENGKKVDKKRAQQIYKQMRAQELRTDKEFRKMQRQMDKMFWDFWPTPMMPRLRLMAPTVIVVN